MKINFTRPLSLSLLIIFLIPLLSGCWDKQEITDLLYVSGLGLDIPAGGDEVEVSIEFIKVSSSKDEKLSSSLFTVRGRDIGDALTALSMNAGGSLDFNYCEAIVMSEAYARHGMANIADMLLRNADIQHTALLAVAEGCSAAEIFAARGKDEPSAAYEISGIIKSNYSQCLSLVKNDAYGVRAALQGPCGCAALTRVYLESEREDNSIMAGGAAVVRKDGLAGWLTPREAAYFRIATGDASGGYESARDMDGGWVTAELRDFSLKTEAKLEGIHPTAGISIKADATLVKPPRAAGDASSAGGDFSDGIRLGVLELFERCRDEMGCDILGLSGEFARTYGGSWRSFEGHWDELLRALELSVSAEVRVEDAGLEKTE